MTHCKLNNQGLYRSEYEHDACGVGMVVNIHGGKSHELVDNALKVLENMEHRGAETRDKTGDGAGIMVQIPHEFILLQGIPVPEKGKYGTGLVFLPKDKKAQEQILSVMIEAMKDCEIVEPMVTIRSRMKATDEPLLEQLADSLL